MHVIDLHTFTIKIELLKNMTDAEFCHMDLGNVYAETPYSREASIGASLGEAAIGGDLIKDGRTAVMPLFN